MTQMTSEIRRLELVYEHLLEFLESKSVQLPETAQPPPVCSFTTDKGSLAEMRIACIMDEFTYLSYEPECKLMPLSIESWQQEIDSFVPDMLFIESAWHGKDGGWYRKIAHGSEELYALVRHCKGKNIPVVYWGKEDPVYTNVFMPAASVADVVFTTDLDSVPIYKKETGNDLVYHLHFAAQPKIHNPIEKFTRKDAFCFAGAYYHRYEKRTQVFDSFADYFMQTRGLDIYDRNYGNPRPEHAFPKRYESNILGKLAPDEIDKAYKGYFFGVTMNSITQSQTMFARRVFELMASNTAVAGNFAHGMKNYFGDLTICTDSVTSLGNALTKYCGEADTMDKYRLAGLRSVLSQHLYQNRLGYIVEKVFNKNLKHILPGIAVVSNAVSQEDRERVTRAFNRQSYENKLLVFIGTETEPPAEADYIAYFSHEDYYGANYLLDLALATRFLSPDIDGICKATNSKPYTFTSAFMQRQGIFKLQSMPGVSLAPVATDIPLSGNFFTIDKFNYAYLCHDDRCEPVDDIQGLDFGISMAEIQAVAESVPMPMQYRNDSAVTLCADEAAGLFNEAAKQRGIAAAIKDGSLHITASDAVKNAEYIYFPKYYPLADASAKGKLSCRFEAVSDDIMGSVIIFYDGNKAKLGSQFIAAGCTVEMSLDTLPKGSEYFRLALRITGKGNAIFKGFSIGEAKLFAPGSVNTPCLVRSDVLVLSNIYPSDDNLYRNMFVHSRVKAYQRKGYSFNVMSSNIYSKDEYREFDGVHVTDGRAQMLADVMNSGKIKTVCVHFLDEQMFTALKPHLEKIKLIIWVHGAEIQPWWRREYNYNDDAEREQAKANSEKRMAFWQEVFAAAQAKENIRFVFVSQYFANEVMEDYKTELPQNKYAIIHNAIDTDTFNYVEKDAEQRKKIFSCRPFASHQYANDLSVKAILALSKRKEFSDMKFYIAGSGDLFKETTAPLRRIKNVTFENRFLTHTEIAAAHKAYGICLIPTRWDSHGVSRDEAMSSGLVPVTTSVAAIPEFVDEACGILAPAEDWQALADGILKMYNDPSLFLELSRNAAARVRRQASANIVIDKELALIQGVV